MKEKPLTIALVGNPNSGKSSLFNLLTGLRQKISNFPGTTVEKKTGFMSYQGRTARIIDLPGIYSLFPKSIDETVSTRVLLDEDPGTSPDLVVAVVDASNLKRNMLLFSQVADLRKPMILALNMVDLARSKGVTIDTQSLARKLGVGVVEINARKNDGIEELKKMMFGMNPAVQQSFFQAWPEACSFIEHHGSNYQQDFQSWLGIHYKYQGGKISLPGIPVVKKKDQLHLQATETVQRYKLIDKLLHQSVKYNPGDDTSSFTYKTDRILTHRIWGFLFFFLLLFVVFQAIFSWSRVPMDLIEEGFTRTGSWLQGLLPEGIISDLLVKGILPGLSGVLVFLPQIVILYAFIAILEDTGYMSRVSFIMDKLMRRFGLNGKSVVPLVSGIACAVPAIMSARTIENRRDRLITILVTPLMSCSARLPVFTLLISLIVPDQRVWGILNMQGLVLMLMYLLGFVSALLLAWVMKIALKKQKGNHYLVMEMPQYRAPRWKSIGLSVTEAARSFVWNAGKIIVAISIVLWFLASFGPPSTFNSIREKYDSAISATIDSTRRDSLQREKDAELLTHSYAGYMGQFIEPVIRPLGFDWKIGIALISSVAAREVFVGTMATMYSVGPDDEDFNSVRQRMQAEINPDTGQPVFTIPVTLSLLIFYAFALQCMSTIAVVHRETRSWKWPLLQFVIMTGMAYLASLAVYQLLK